MIREEEGVDVSACTSCGFKSEPRRQRKRKKERVSEKCDTRQAIQSDLEVKGQIREMFFYCFLLISASVIVLATCTPSNFFFANAIREMFTHSSFDALGYVSAVSQFANLDEDEDVSGKRSQTTYSEKSNFNITELKQPKEKPNLRFGHTVNDSIPAKRTSGGDFWGATFNTIDTPGQFWRFVVTLLPHLFYWDFWRPLGDTDSVLNHTEYDDTYDFYNARMIGVPRIRQVRVGNRSCLLHPGLSDLFKYCYAGYSASTEETSDIQPKTGFIAITAPAWKYRRENLNMTNVEGRISTYYPGGYMLDLGRNKMEARAKLLNLRDNGWITQATRAVMIDIILYSPDTDIFLICQLLAEFPPTGGVVPSASFIPYKFFSNTTVADSVVICFQITLGILLVYFFSLFIKKVIKYKWKVLFNFWLMIDFICVMLAVAMVAIMAYKFVFIEPYLGQLMQYENVYVSFDHPGNIQYFIDNMGPLMLLLLWVKLLKYLTFIPTIHFIIKTLAISIKGICQFASICVVIFFALGQLGHLFFGYYMTQYMSLKLGILTVLRTSLKELSFDDTLTVSVFFAVMFFALTLFFVPLVLRNLFVCLIADCYDDAKSQVLPTDDYTVQSYLSRFIDRLLKRKSVQPTCGIEVNAKHHLREILRRENFQDYEIDVFFSKYQVQISGNITEREAKRVNNEIALRKYQFDDTSHPRSSDEFYNVISLYKDRVGAMMKKFEN